jgi:hypothetical protein
MTAAKIGTVPRERLRRREISFPLLQPVLGMDKNAALTVMVVCAGPFKLGKAAKDALAADSAAVRLNAVAGPA